MKGSSIPGGWFTIAILALLVLAAFVVAVRIARRTMRTNRGSGQGLFGMHELSAAEHRATAQAHAAQGNWPPRFDTVSERSPVSSRRPDCSNPVPGRTASELAHDAGELLPGFSTTCGSAATVFNDVTYGEQPGTEADYRTVADLDDALRRHTAPSAAGAADPMVTDTWVPLR